MGKYKDAVCCKCLGTIMVLESDYADFYCNTCAWSKVGDVRIPYTPAEGQS
jgi:hypothetical protein